MKGAGGLFGANARRVSIAGAAQQRFDARQQFERLEGLGEVIVGAQFQSYDFVRQLTTCGEHQDRRIDPALAQVAAHVKTALPRKHHVENHHIEVSRAGAFQSVSSGGGALKLVAFGGQ
jgi:hypothetical protein